MYSFPGCHSPDQSGLIAFQRSPPCRQRTFFSAYGQRTLFSACRRHVHDCPCRLPLPPGSLSSDRIYRLADRIPSTVTLRSNSLFTNPGTLDPIPSSARPARRNRIPHPTRRLPGPGGRNGSRNSMPGTRMPIHDNPSRQQKHPRKQPPEDRHRPSALARRNTLLDTRPDGIRRNKFQVMHSSLYLLFKFWVVHSSIHFFLPLRIC